MHMDLVLKSFVYVNFKLGIARSSSIQSRDFDESAQDYEITRSVFLIRDPKAEGRELARDCREMERERETG